MKEAIMAIIDMRPAKGTILYELLRLGLSFESKSLDGHNVWINYQTQLRAEFDTDGEGNLIEGVRLTDLVTRISKIVTIEDLANTSEIITWTSKNPTGPTENGDPAIDITQ
jgi:hypothetical protein